MTREEEIEYAMANGIPVPATKASPYSTDENLWGRSVECGILEDPAIEPPEEAFAWTSSPADAPDEPAYANVRFERGVPVALNGQAMDFLAIVEKLNGIAGAHGVGRIDHVESRVVGIKSREVYECPAAIVLIRAHQALEAMVLPRDVLDFKRSVEARYSLLIYDGFWFTPLREVLDAFVEETQVRVTGEVSVKLFKGSATVVGRTSPLALYQHQLATYSSGDRFRQEMAEGFIYVWGLPARTWAAVGEQGKATKLVKAAKRVK
jgi:argininosuccinate synthase